MNENNKKFNLLYCVIPCKCVMKKHIENYTKLMHISLVNEWGEKKNKIKKQLFHQQHEKLLHMEIEWWNFYVTAHNIHENFIFHFREASMLENEICSF